jgi:tetracycline resistance efflux pump
MQHILALAPVALTLIIAFQTRQMLLAFASGIISAALLVNNFDVLETGKFIALRFLEKSEILNFFSSTTFWKSEKLFIFIFLICIGSIIELIQMSGASKAYSAFIHKHLKSRRQAEYATLGFSFFLFFDDYFNVITTGSVMTQITDMFGIARLRCAQLIGNTAAAAASIMPLSTWGAAIAGTIASAGLNLLPESLIHLHPFLSYVWAVPFATYPITLIAITWISVTSGTLIGLAKNRQDITNLTTDLHCDHTEHAATEHHHKHNHNASLLDFVLPIATLIVSLIIAIFYTGKLTAFGGTNSLLEAIRNTNLTLSMFMSGIYTLIVASAWFVTRKKLHIISVAKALKNGFLIMWPSILVLSLSWTFGSIVAQDLHIGKIIVNQLLPLFSMHYLPPTFFAIAALTTFCIGSAWGTMSLLYPIAIPMLAQLQNLAPSVLIYQTIGAILSGAVLGNNTSPLTDLSTMTSNITETKQMDYVQAQVDFNKPIIWGVMLSLLLSSFLEIESYGLCACMTLGCSILFSWVGIEAVAKLEEK